MASKDGSIREFDFHAPQWSRMEVHRGLYCSKDHHTMFLTLVLTFPSTLVRLALIQYYYSTIRTCNYSMLGLFLKWLTSLLISASASRRMKSAELFPDSLDDDIEESCRILARLCDRKVRALQGITIMNVPNESTVLEVCTGIVI